MTHSSYRHQLQYGVAFVVLFNGIFAAFLLFHPVPYSAVVTVDDIVAFVGPLLATAAFALSAVGPWLKQSAQPKPSPRPGRLQRWAPLLIILGVFSFAVGEVIWAHYELLLHHPSPFPSWADAAFLAVYPLLFAGILLLPPRRPSAVSRTRIVLDGLLIMTALVTVSWYFILGPTVLAGSESILARVVGTAYPLFDLILVFCVLMLMARDNGPFRPIALLLSIGLAAVIVTDTVFDYEQLHGTYATGTVVDAGWTIGYMLMGLSALLARTLIRERAVDVEPEEPGVDPADWNSDLPLWRGLLPYALAPLALALIVYSLRHHGDEQLEPGLLVGSAVLFGLILVRQFLSILENRQLTAHVRQQLDFTGAMMRSLGEGVYALDMAGCITYMNPAAQRMLGWTEEDLLGKNLHEIVHATVTGARGSLCPLMEALQRGVAVQREEEILIRKDGSVLPVAYSAAPIESEGQQSGMVVVFQDVTASKQAQEALCDSEERYRGVVEASADAIALIDLHGVITMANPGAAHLFGHATPGELLGVSIFDLISPHDHALVQQHLRERATMEKPAGRDTEYTFIRRDAGLFTGEVNSTVIFDDKGNPKSVAVVARDITDRRRAEEALRESEERYRELFENANDIVYTHDLQGHFTSINHAAERVTGYSREEVLRLNIADVIVPEHLELAQQMIQHKVGSNRAMTYEVDIVAQDGTRVPVEVSTRLIWHDGKPVGVQGVARDITERRRAVAALAHQALHDALTGLPNRALLRDRLQQAILVAQRERSSLALFFMDLDRFKEVNDTFGHHCGDALLQQLAVRLQRAVHESDTVARLGGDEFAVLLPATDETGAAAAARKLIAALEQPFEIEGHVFDVGASIGCALHPDHGADASTLMRKADVAMYIAKRTDSEYATYSPDHDKNDPARLVLMRELRCALEEDAASSSPGPLPPHGRLVLHYQPQLNVKIGCTDHVEALVRWQHPERGLLFPGAFVPLAEETGLLEPLTRWVLTEALHQSAIWQEAGQDIRVAVNLSPRSLHDPQLGETIATLLENSGVKASGLQVEITESAIIVNPERAREILNRLHDMGVQVALDDFGTGYSSLAYLKRLPIDDIKIDRSFVTNLTENSDNAFIVQSVIDLGHNLGLEVIAEGVENAATYDYLARMGCDMIQGYYLSRPLAPADLARWYEALEDTRAAG